MKIETPVAFSFIMPDELYLLHNDKVVGPAPSTSMPIPEPSPAPAIKTPPVNFNFMGGNKKKFLIITHYPDLEFINDTHLTALENILKRLEVTLDDAAIFNIAKYAGTGYQQVVGSFKPERLLLLGKNALPPGIGQLTLNQPQQLNNCNILFSFSFDEMMDSNENKKAFWEQMKKL